MYIQNCTRCTKAVFFLAAIAAGVAIWYNATDEEVFDPFSPTFEGMSTVSKASILSDNLIDDSPYDFQIEKKPVEPPTIFVSFASFLNKDSSHMLENIYKTAKHPQNVFVGMLHHTFEKQENQWEPKVWNKICANSTQFCPRGNVRVISGQNIPFSGPSDAHFATQKVYSGQHFYLMVHDNTAFVREWDRILTERYVAAVQKAGHDRVALSHPLPRWLIYTQREMNEFGQIRVWQRAKTNDFGYLDLYADDTGITEAPFEQYYSTDALLFAPAAIVNEVPRDPGIQFLHNSCDLLYSARLWTSKWDMYHPGTTVAFRKQAYREGKSWAHVDQTWKALRKGSINRLQCILLLNRTEFPIHSERDKTFAEFFSNRNIDSFRLGTRRTVASYWERLRSSLRVEE